MKSNLPENRGLPPYVDPQQLTEDERIELTARMVVEHKKTIGIVLEQDAKKIKRYREKLEAARPGMLEIEEPKRLTKDTVLLKIKPKENT